MNKCEVCEGAGTVIVAVGPIDPFGVPDDTVEAPCPHCPAGDAEAEHRIGRSWRTPFSSSSSQGPLDPTDPRHDDPDATAQDAASGADHSHNPFTAAHLPSGEARHDTPSSHVVAAMPARAGALTPSAPAHRPTRSTP